MPIVIVIAADGASAIDGVSSDAGRQNGRDGN